MNNEKFRGNKIWIWRDAAPQELDVYIGDPKSSPPRLASVGGIYRLESDSFLIIKLYTTLPISQGMPLTPSKFFDFTTGSAAKLLFFTPDQVSTIFNHILTKRLINKTDNKKSYFLRLKFLYRSCTLWTQLHWPKLTALIYCHQTNMMNMILSFKRAQSQIWRLEAAAYVRFN